MSLVVPNQGEQLMLQLVLNQTLKLKLFKNNVTPGETDTEATYTEATFTGYAEKSLTYGHWGFTPGGPTVGLYDTAQDFTSSADQTAEPIYGYYVVQASDGKLLWAERFSDAPNNVTNNGDIIRITPRITLE